MLKHTPSFFKNSTKISYMFSTKLQSAHTIGAPFNDLIKISTAEVLLKMTQKYPNKIAINSYHQDVSLTYQQLTQRALKLANSLIKDFQIKPKDRVGIYSFNKWEWYVVQLACTFVDAILVNINPSYKSEELAYTLQKVRVKVLFISDQFKNSDYLEIIRKTVPEISKKDSHPFRLSSHKFPFLDSVVRMRDPHQQKHISGFVNFQNLLEYPASMESLPKAWPSCEDEANIQFTSGTTGLPKAATLSHFNILNNGYAVGKRLRYTENDNICIPVPLYHCFGMILGNLAGLTRGATLTYVCQGFDPKKTLEAVSKYNCTALYGVPTMFSQYLRIYQSNPASYDISKLRTGIIAGSLAPEKLMNQILNVLSIKQITNCYGMTETSPVSFQTAVEDTFLQKTTTVGSILQGLQAKIVNPETLQTCKTGESGEFVVKGWAVMSGYWQDPIANEKSFINKEWMRSGDLGVIDESGYLTIVGRIKDMIIRGGENVYPKQIEEYLNKNLDGVIDVQVVGVSDEKFGEEIVALVKVKDLSSNRWSKEDVYGICKGKIAHYKVPKYVKFVQDLPLTVTGKPQKYIMRESIEEQKRISGLQKYAVR